MSKNIRANDSVVFEGIFDKGFGVLSFAVMSDRRLSQQAKLIYSYLVSLAGAVNQAFPSVPRICADLQIGSEDTFYHHLDYLKGYGLIKVTPRYKSGGKFDSNLYSIVVSNPVIQTEYLDRIELFKQKQKERNAKKKVSKNNTPGNQGTDEKTKILQFNTPGNQGTGNQGTGNQGTTNTIITSTIITSTNTHTDLKTLCVEIQKVLTEKISQKKIQELINAVGLDTLKQYIDTWDKYRPFARQGQAAYFIHCVQHQIPAPTPQAITYSNKTPQFSNFEQREYSDDDYEKFYANLNS